MIDYEYFICELQYYFVLLKPKNLLFNEISCSKAFHHLLNVHWTVPPNENEIPVQRTGFCSAG
jgi:hypothetical protein